MVNNRQLVWNLFVFQWIGTKYHTTTNRHTYDECIEPLFQYLILNNKYIFQFYNYQDWYVICKAPNTDNIDPPLLIRFSVSDTIQSCGNMLNRVELDNVMSTDLRREIIQRNCYNISVILMMVRITASKSTSIINVMSYHRNLQNPSWPYASES